MTRPSLQPSQQLLANLEGRRRRCRRRQAAAGKFVPIPACRSLSSILPSRSLPSHTPRRFFGLCIFFIFFKKVPIFACFCLFIHPDGTGLAFFFFITNFGNFGDCWGITCQMLQEGVGGSGGFEASCSRSVF